MNAKQKKVLRKFVIELEKYRGRHTELVSVYVPAGYELIKVIQHLQEEQGTAENIKDKTTRNNVIDALERMIRHLKLFKRTPDNGLAAFAGNISEKEGQQDLQVWSVEPPIPLKTRIYRCDQTFVLDLLREMIDINDTYGLITMDNREATIGLLRGTLITKIASMTSSVPGKIKAGGQCIGLDSLIMLDNGLIIPIKEAHNPHIIVSENFNKEALEFTPIITKWSNKKELFKIITKYPGVEIDASLDHNFFVRTSEGIIEKPLSEIKIGDYLIMPEKINLDLQDQKINFKPLMKNKHKEIIIPKQINPDFARLLGYYLGDGCYEKDRLTFFEQRKQVAEDYKKLLEKIFGIEAHLKFRESKNYYQIRIYSRVLSQLIKSIFDDKNKTLYQGIPDVIMQSSDNSLKSFIGGIFDAEGYVSSGITGLGINNKILAKQIQLILLRIGILSSLSSYDNRKNPYSKNIRYNIKITDNESLKTFCNLVKFTSLEKQSKLKEIIKFRSNKNLVRQIVINGKDIARILRNSGISTTQFRNPDFFVNKKQMSKELFKKNIIDKIKDETLKRRLNLFYESNLIAVKISKIFSIGLNDTIDIETKNHNFIVNGLIVHNSQQRFARLREEAAHEFYKRIAEISNAEFLGMKESLKGIILGGPGPTKENFFNGAYINNEIKKKVLGVKDITYTDEYGLQELVEKSQDILASQDITKEKALMQKFFELLNKDESKSAYGLAKVEKALEYGAVDTLLISETIDDTLEEKLEAKAESTGAKVELISIETNEGQQLRDLGGVAAILRFSFTQ